MKKTRKSSSGATAPKAPQVREQRHALLDALDNTQDAKERLEACAALAAKFEPMEDDDEDLANRLKKEIISLGRDGMFKSLVRCANDPDLLVRATAIGALRNLALTGRDKALTLMQQEDAWSAMCVVLMKNAANDKKLETAAQKEALHVMELMSEWSVAVAEKRLSDSLNVIAPALYQSSDPEVVEACAKLLFTASEDNSQLAKAMLSSEAGRALGQALETLATKLTSTNEDNNQLIAGAYALGVLLNLSSVSGIRELPALIAKWVANCSQVLSDLALPLTRLAEEIINDAKAFEEDVIDEEGATKSESAKMRYYLDVVQTQALLFDIWGGVLRKVAAETEEANAKAREYWASCIFPLEERGLLPCALTFALNSLPQDCPKSLSLAVASLQESAAQCAAAAFEAYVHIDTAMCRETFHRFLAALTSTTPSDRELAVAYAELVAASARRAEQNVFGSELEASQVLRLMQESALEPVRALMCGPIVKLCESNVAQFLPIIAPVLLEQLGKEKSIVVSAEIADTLMDLFSEDDRQELFDSLGGLSVFAGLLKTFDKRLQQAKREVEPLDEEAEQRVLDVKTNLEAFTEWKNQTS